MRVENAQPWINTYWVDGEYGWQDEYYHWPVQKGDGMIVAQQRYRRFRVIDIWYSDDKHGRFDTGRHIFLKDVTGLDDDRPGETAPDYFTSSTERP